MGVHSFVDLSRTSTWPFYCTARLGLSDAIIYRPDRSTKLLATQASQRKTIIIVCVYKSLLASG